MDFLGQAAFRTNAHAIAHQQHADCQFGVDRRATGAAVKWLQGSADACEIETLISAAQLMIGLDVVIEAEVIEQPRRCRLYAHHRRFPHKSVGKVNHATLSTAKDPQSGRRIAREL
jgi:hypothetical protein